MDWLTLAVSVVAAGFSLAAWRKSIRGEQSEKNLRYVLRRELGTDGL